MNSMFNKCESSYFIIGLDKFNTGKVETIKNMFIIFILKELKIYNFLS